MLSYKLNIKIWHLNASFVKTSHDLIVITPSEFIEIREENYHLMWKSCLQVREMTQKSYNESKKNRKCWYGVHCTSCKGILCLPKA